MSSPADPAAAKYRFAFVLNTTIGNMTRYQNLRKYAEKAGDIEFFWTPISAYPPPDVARRFSAVPNVWLARAWIFRQMVPVFRRLGTLDAVMVHLFEAELALVARACVLKSPLIVSSTDKAPAFEEDTYPLYEYQKRKSRRRRRFRLRLDRWRAGRVDLFIPFTAWAAGLIQRGCRLPASKVRAVHVGIDLETWTRTAARRDGTGERLKILFVGGEFARKGGELLLALFRERFHDRAELHLVTNQAPQLSDAHVHVHANIRPNDAALVRLFADCDMLVVPTSADLAPWVFLEAMAMQCPPIGTSVGAIAEFIDDGVTGFVVPPGDGNALGARIEQLLEDPALRARMGLAGRLKIERDYDAAKNVPRILSLMRAAVDAARTR